MRIHDVNVLVGAFREDTVDHSRFRAAFDVDVLGGMAWGYSPLMLAGFIRIVTNSRVFNTPNTTAEATRFADSLVGQPNSIEVLPGVRHWSIFRELCLATNATGNLVPDAYHAALAIEAGADLVTADRDFAQFDGLRSIHPFLIA